MNWLKEHTKQIAIAIVIIILMAIIVMSMSKHDSALPAENLVETPLTAVETPVSYSANAASSFFSGLFNFRSIQKENYQLKQQLADMTKELSAAQLSQLELAELKALQNNLSFSTYDDTYTPVSAYVTAIDGSDFFDIFTINAGSKKGIKNDDLVVCSDGLVGRIMNTGGSWSKVAGIIDASNSVSFTVLRDPEVVGVISGDGEGGLTGYIFDESKSIIEGDTIVTSGLGYYPGGIKIGTVDTVTIDPNTRNKTITAKSAVNFNSLRIVCVMTDGTKEVE